MPDPSPTLNGPAPAILSRRNGDVGSLRGDVGGQNKTVGRLRESVGAQLKTVGPLRGIVGDQNKTVGSLREPVGGQNKTVGSLRELRGRLRSAIYSETGTRARATQRLPLVPKLHFGTPLGSEIPLRREGVCCGWAIPHHPADAPPARSATSPSSAFPSATWERGLKFRLARGGKRWRCAGHEAAFPPSPLQKPAVLSGTLSLFSATFVA